MRKSNLRLISPTKEIRTVMPTRHPNSELRPREHLTEREVEKLIVAGFVDDHGNYAQQGPDFQGQTRRLRTYDGVNFTNYGAEKLAHYVEHELRRVLTSHVLPVALPVPEEQSPANGAAVVRPAIGPVVPLSAIGGGEGGDLLGAASHPPEQEATRVPNRGDAIVAPPGRADDDFSWPRADTSASGAVDVGPAPDDMPPKVSTGKNDSEDGNKNGANKPETIKSSDTKNHPAQSVAPPPTRHFTTAQPRRPGGQLDGAPPRPPLPVGPAVSNSR